MADDATRGKKKGNPRRWLWLIIVLLIVAFLSSGIYTVKETEEAVIQSFGRYSHTVGPGLHIKFPWPFQQVTVLPVQMTQRMELGYYQDDTGYHPDSDDGLMITGDMSVVNIDFFLEWKISNPVTYLFSTQDPVAVLRNLLMSSVRSIVGTKTIDDALTTGKFEIQNEVQEMLMEKLEENDIGVQILDVKLNNSKPPTEEISKAFREVENAKQERDTALNRATEYRNRKIPEAKAEADRVVKAAEAYKNSRIAEAEGLYDRYATVYEQYRQFPDINQERMYLEILEDTLPEIKVIVDDTGTVTKFLPLEDLSGKAPDKAETKDSELQKNTQDKGDY